MASKSKKKSKKSLTKTVAKTVSKALKAPKVSKDSESTIAKRGADAATKRYRRPQKLHVRESASKDSDTLCGGSHSELWNRSGDRPLQTVGPQQAGKTTCGRCRRVAKARKLVA